MSLIDDYLARTAELSAVLSRYDRVTTLLEAIVRAWRDLDHDQRVALGEAHPELAEGLIRLDAGLK